MARKVSKHRWNIGSIISLVIGIVLVCAISYLGIKTYRESHAAAAASIYVNPSSATLTTGSTVSVTVRENSGTDPVNSVQASLNYDSNQLQYVDLVEGGAFPVIAATSTNTPGVVRIGRANASTPQTGDQAIVTVNFKVIGSSGTGAITIDRAYSLLVRSTDNKDMLQSVGNGSYAFTGGSTAPNPTPTPPPPSPPSSNGKPVLYISPASGNYAVGSTIAATVKLNSFTTATSTVEAVVGYPTDKLQFVDVTEGGAYTTQQRTKNANGTIDIIRGIAGGGDGKQGENTVATVNFKVLANNGTAALTLNSGSAAYDTSGSGANILDLAASTGASYTLSASGASDSAGSNNTSPKTITTPSQSLKITTKAGSSASVTTYNGNVATELKGEVTLAPATTTASDGVSTISKVEYYLDKKLIATKKSEPFTYNFDTKKLRNGQYTMVIKTYFTNGTVDTNSELLVVKNKVTLSYVMRQYAPSAAALIAILVVCAFLLWKLVIPRFAVAKTRVPVDVTGMQIGGSAPTDRSQSDALPVMADPVVVTPGDPAASGESNASIAAAPTVVAPPAPQAATETTTYQPKQVTSPSVHGQNDDLDYNGSKPVAGVAPAQPTPTIIQPTAPSSDDANQNKA